MFNYKVNKMLRMSVAGRDKFVKTTVFIQSFEKSVGISFRK